MVQGYLVDVDNPPRRRFAYGIGHSVYSTAFVVGQATPFAATPNHYFACVNVVANAGNTANLTIYCDWQSAV